MRSTAALALLLPVLAWGDYPDIPRTDLEIKVDGVMDDEAWQHATQIALDIETLPGENIPASIETTAYLIENGDSLFVAFRAEDPEPDKIRAFLRDRDEAYSDDMIGIVLDTYNDDRRAFEFFVNPFGVQMDLTNDDVNKNEDDSWNAIWDSAGKITDFGYVVELEIPLSQLRFPDIEGKQTWGIDLVRFYPRDFRYRFANNPDDRNVNCYLCQLAEIQGLQDAKPSRDLEIVPTLVAASTESTDDPGVVPLSGEEDAEVGLTVRWGITPDMTANLAINPDFSQIEADVPQLDVNNQFALFFPETRPFFLEGADYFTTPQQIVYTRTVADPALAAKLTGKKGRNQFGIYAAQDEITNFLIPGAFGSDIDQLDIENTQVVGRYSRGFGEASTVGAVFTARKADDYHNYVGGADMRWRINDQHNIRLQYLVSDTLYPEEIATEYDQPLDSFDGDSLLIHYEYNTRDWYARAFHRDRSAGFRADSGFITQVDTSFQVLSLARKWWGDAGDWWSQMQVRADWDIKHDESGQMLEREAELRYSINGPLQSFLQVEVESGTQLFDDIWFDPYEFAFYGEFQPRGGLQMGLSAAVGEQIDFANSRIGEQVALDPFINWNINEHFLARFQGSFVRLDTLEGENIFDAKLYDLRLTWQFNVRAFIRLTAQYQDVTRNPDVYIDPVDENEKDLGRQLLFSYTINPQTVFYLGYSDQLIEDDSLTKLETTDRTWFMKIGYAWTP